jgi:transcriptional regulator with XRE-family HTH domain
MASGLKLYKSYMFKDKDPIIDRMRTILSDEGLKASEACELSGISPTTLHNWFKGETRRPQFATVMALARSIGYDVQLVRPSRNVSGSKVTLQKTTHNSRSSAHSSALN